MSNVRYHFRGREGHSIQGPGPWGGPPCGGGGQSLFFGKTGISIVTVLISVVVLRLALVNTVDVVTGVVVTVAVTSS